MEDLKAISSVPKASYDVVVMMGGDINIEAVN